MGICKLVARKRGMGALGGRISSSAITGTREGVMRGEVASPEELQVVIVAANGNPRKFLGVFTQPVDYDM